MYTHSVRPARGGTWLLAAVFGAMVLLALFAGAQVASAQGPTEGVTGVACMNTSPCTAGDTRIADITVLNVAACLDDGNGNLYADVIMKAHLQSTADQRYDIGLWVALDGGAQHRAGQPVLPRDPATARASGHFQCRRRIPFHDLDGDYCGDIQKTDPDAYATLQTLKIKCTDTSGTGLVNSISTCTSYDNNAGTQCSSIAGAVPGTGSKCKCGATPITPIAISQIVVRKVTVPPSAGDLNPPVFNFTVTGTGLTPNPTTFSLMDQGSWPSGTLPPGGTYSVVENTPLPAEWDFTKVACTDGKNPYDPAGFTMPPGKTVECTFTNTKRGTVIITKNSVGGDGTFDFTSTGGLGTTPFSLITSSGTKSITYSNVTPGAYSVTEDTQTSPWDFTGLACTETGGVNTNPSTTAGQVATIKVDPGETVTCTFTNTKRGTVIVTKNSVGGDGEASTLRAQASWGRRPSC